MDDQKKRPPWFKKDPPTRKLHNRNRPKACQLVMSKILMDQIRRRFIIRWQAADSSPKKRKDDASQQEEQEICCTLTNTSSRRANLDDKNVTMEWIDCKRGYDMLLQSGIINCLKKYKISNEVIKFIEQSMRNGKWNWQQEKIFQLRLKPWEVYSREMSYYQYNLW